MQKKKGILLISGLVLVLLSGLTLITIVVAWFNGQGFMGKTMSYSKNILIGSNYSNVKNYHGVQSAVGQVLQYELIDVEGGFEESNLVPGGHVYIRTDVYNESEEFNLNFSLFLNNVSYSEVLNSFLYFGVTEPELSKNIFKDRAILSENKLKYTIDSLPIATNLVVSPQRTISVYWFLNIDSGAGLEVANTQINLGSTVITYS